MANSQHRAHLCELGHDRVALGHGNARTHRADAQTGLLEHAAERAKLKYCARPRVYAFIPHDGTQALRPGRTCMFETTTVR